MFSIFSFMAMILVLFIFLITHDVEFIAIAFLIIYIGAIMILFLFVIFLLDLYNYKTERKWFISKHINTFAYISCIGLILIKGFLIFLFVGIEINSLSIHILEFGYTGFSKYEQMSVLALTKLNFFHVYDINDIGYLLYGDFTSYLILCALILLVALIGSVVLMRDITAEK
jgi:NADH:ubiquinone oxidoreductase subunit 6 (subunit J)